MHRIFLVLLILLSLSHLQAKDRILSPHLTLKVGDEQDVRAYVVEQYPELRMPGLQLEQIWLQRTRAATYHTFGLTYQGRFIANACVKVVVDQQNKVISAVSECPDVRLFAGMNVDPSLLRWEQGLEALPWLNAYPFASAVQEKNIKWLPLNGRIESVLEVRAWNRQLDRTDYFLPNGELVLSYDHMRRYRKDTVVSARIFNPDPLTKLGLVYGGSFVDLADAGQAWFAPAYETVNIPAAYDTNLHVFILENQWVRIEDFESPDIDSATSATPSFLFDRSQSGFEDCNVMYHISFFQDYIASIGYDTLMALQLAVDTHGQFGADNSYFLRNGGNPLASFGTGGVDDAEDADVIIHEYCHGISWSANGNGNFTAERSGLDEGLADYFATSYSRTINPFAWENVFSWDGHNEYWAGRIANTSATYPSAGNIYAVGELWNSAMSGIWGGLGSIVTDKLMLESLHFFTDSTALPQAARYVMKADTLLFGGVHSWMLCVHFSNRGILPGNCAPLGLGETANASGILVAKSLEFAKSEQPLQVLFDRPETGELLVRDLHGKVVHRQVFLQETQLGLTYEPFSPGVYLLEVRSRSGLFHTKISRW